MLRNHAEMNATNLYVSTSRLILQAKVEDPSSWLDLYRLFSSLRQSLSCTVCGELLIEPYTPTETTCQHHVCRSCKGGKKKLKPACSWCKDYAKYNENVQLRTLLQCYKKLCQYVISSGIYSHLASIPSGGIITVESCNHFLELIKEGSGFKDEYQYPAKSISKLLRSPSKSASTQTDKDDKVKIGNGKPTTYAVICADENRLTIKRTQKSSVADKRNGTSQKDKSEKSRKRRQTSSKLVRLKKGRRPGREREPKRLQAGRKSTDSKIDESRKSSPEATSPPLTRPKKRKPHEENIPTKVNKVRKRTEFVKPPTCRCGHADQCKGACRGYRCPCYSADKSCLDCTCIGCKNPRGASLNKDYTAVENKIKEEPVKEKA